MKSESKTHAVKLFFQNFKKHLERIRDGESQQKEQRAQILISQLNLFEKAIQEVPVPPQHERHEFGDLKTLFEVDSLNDFVQWASKSRTSFSLENLYLLGPDASWLQMLGNKPMPSKLVVRQWLLTGQLGALADDPNAYLIYVHGQPRLLLVFSQDVSGLAQSIAKYLARQLIFWLPTSVPRPFHLSSVSGLIAHNPAFLEMLERLGHAAKTDVTILLEGESGTGKEVLTSYIHDSSPRKGKALIAVNCAAIPPGLIESELFGHEKGSFTGAVGRQIGRVEEAHGGTLFLDEIGEMELSMQAKLLRFLQLKEFHRVGGKQKISVDVRIVAATNRKLKKQVAEGHFREDLYYRLSVMPFQVSPLRERIEDIAPLFQFFLQKYALSFGFQPPEVDPLVVQYLTKYEFPGNVRELENLTQNILVVAQGLPIQLKHLPDVLISQAAQELPHPQNRVSGRRWWHKNVRFRTLKMPRRGGRESTAEQSLSWLLEVPCDNDELKTVRDRIQAYAHELTMEVESRFIKDLLERAGGSMQKASALGKINRTLLYKMMDRCQKSRQGQDPDS